MPVTASFKFDDFEAQFTWFIFSLSQRILRLPDREINKYRIITVHLEKVIVNFVYFCFSLKINNYEYDFRSRFGVLGTKKN